MSSENVTLNVQRLLETLIFSNTNLQEEHSAIHSNFIKLPFVINIFVFIIFEWPFCTGLTVFTAIEALSLSLGLICLSKSIRELSYLCPICQEQMDLMIYLKYS